MDQRDHGRRAELSDNDLFEGVGAHVPAPFRCVAIGVITWHMGG